MFVLLCCQRGLMDGLLSNVYDKFHEKYTFEKKTETVLRKV